MRRLLAATLLQLPLALASAQGISPIDLFDHAGHDSSLTFEGMPFHAVMDIGASGQPYSGRVEVWWSSPTVYKSAITSPQLSRTTVVNGGTQQETVNGDFLPRWLDDFEQAILNPEATRSNFLRGNLSASQSMSSSGDKQFCIRRDDRPGNVTDQMTWGIFCFKLAGKSTLIDSVNTFSRYMEFSDYKGFGDKHIARSYSTDVLDYKPVKATLSKLERLPSMPADFFAVTHSTPAPSAFATTMVSTLTEEQMVEHAPVIEWPSVREGKTEGYMIVYARTDRTGQVRETAKHNSDQPGLESFGMEQALKYKFKPLIANGEPVQMEMPLVLHFTSKLDNPLPILTPEQMKAQMPSCTIQQPADLPRGTTITLRISVDENGKMTGAGPVTPVAGASWLASMESLHACTFRPYVVNGKVSYYKGDIILGSR